MARAKDLLLRSRPISGPEAVSLGLVANCVAADDVVSTAIEIATELSTGPQWAVRGTKRALNHWLQLAAPAYEHSATLEALNTLHADSAAGREAVLTKQAPAFPSARSE